MDHARGLRKACFKALRLCEQTEKQAKQTQAAAARQRDATLRDTRQNHAQARQGIDDLLKEVRGWAQQGDRFLSELDLTADPPWPFIPPSSTAVDELTRLLQNHRGQARESSERLKRTAEELKKERRKWWKFW